MRVFDMLGVMRIAVAAAILGAVSCGSPPAEAGGRVEPREAAPCRCAEENPFEACRCLHCEGEEGARCYCRTGGCRCGTRMPALCGSSGSEDLRLFRPVMSLEQLSLA